MKLKAIETIYNGYRFRSRLEARWAVFFDSMGIEYEYEKEGYETPYGWYLPDFWLPEQGSFVEIKGDLTDEVGLKKFRYFDSHSPEPYMQGILLSELNFLEDGETYEECLEGLGCHWVAKEEFYEKYIKVQMLGLDFETYNKGILAARSARFEHGEKPVL